MTALDHAVFLSINGWGHPALDVFFGVLSELGKGEYATLITLALLLWAWRRIHVIPALMLVLATVGAGLTTEWLKDAVGRERPLTVLADQVHVVGEELYHRSFPSGHAASAGSLCVAACRLSGRRRAWWLGIPLAFLVGLSRIYVGAHFPLDVLAGWLLGAAFGELGFRLNGLAERVSGSPPRGA